MNNILKLWGLGLTLAVIVSLSKALTTSGFHPMHIALLQAAGSVFVLGAFGLPNIKTTTRQHWRFFAIASLLGFTLPQMIVFSAAEKLGVGIASLTYALPLLITWLLSLAFKLETFRFKHLFVLLAAVSGTALYLYQADLFINTALHTSETGFWLFILALVPVSLGVANIYRVQFWPARQPTLHVAIMTNLFSAMSYIVFMPVLGDQTLPSSEIMLSASSLGLILLVVILGGINQLLLFSLHRTAAPVFISQIGSVTTLCGGLLGFIVYQEMYTAQTLIASLIILISVTVFSRMKMAEKSSQPKQQRLNLTAASCSK
ncbi:EamA family transporter [Endozoicomonas sp. OPT23]|uniref:EamA family transporter n=1 Tax=Endozoicomonas sp. OPT23 TaxID=2072845 RepID=UPI0018915EF8|nr:EamA family transporter [Endozoicomonas sp. OPT23]